MKVKSLYIYPVKSLGKIDLETAFAGERGFAFDRKWIIVDHEGDFITQLKYPFLSKINVDIQNNSLVLIDKENNDVYSFDISSILDETIPLKNRKDAIAGRKVDLQLDQWISRKVGKEVNLIKMDTGSTRYMESSDKDPATAMSFADTFPYLFTNTASLNELNLKLSEPITIDRFRSNIVIDCNQPFIEDKWKKIKIGEVVFQFIKPCARCKMINIDPESGIMHKKEPYLTLSSFRKSEAGITFGIYMMAQNNGKISKGDEVEILD